MNFPQGKRCFWPVAVSRHFPGKNDFDFDLWWFRVIPQGKNVFDLWFCVILQEGFALSLSYDGFTLFSRKKVFDKIAKLPNFKGEKWGGVQTTMNPTKTNTLHYGTDQKNSLFCCVCFSSRLFYHFLSFVYFLLWKGRERFLKLALFLLSVLVKGEPFWILSVLVRGRNFNTGSGSRS